MLCVRKIYGEKSVEGGWNEVCMLKGVEADRKQIYCTCRPRNKVNPPIWRKRKIM
jgi:hypothetical protein